MRRKESKPNYRKIVLRLPDLDHEKQPYSTDKNDLAEQTLREAPGAGLQETPARRTCNSKLTDGTGAPAIVAAEILQGRSLAARGDERSRKSKHANLGHNRPAKPAWREPAGTIQIRRSGAAAAFRVWRATKAKSRHFSRLQPARSRPAAGADLHCLAKARPGRQMASQIEFLHKINHLREKTSLSSPVCIARSLRSVLNSQNILTFSFDS